MKDVRLCVVEGCTNTARSRGWCERHYGRYRRYGDPEAGGPDRNPAEPPMHEAVGITYRQLDYWSRLGHLRPTMARPGSGMRRSWPESEVRVAEVMSRLTEAGFTVEAAALLARATVENDTRYHIVGPGLALHVDLPPSKTRET